MEKPSVFISYNQSSVKFVTEIVKRLDGIADVHWDQNVGPLESFSTFMNTIRKQDYAILITSDLYLKSSACLFEVTQLMDVESWDKKTLFIVENDANKIFKANCWFEYLDYWDNKINEFKERLSKHSYAEILQTELTKMEKIKEQITPFLKTVADTRIPDMWKAIDSIVERLKISGKKNSANEIEKIIIELIVKGQNTIKDLMLATNRSYSCIREYILKLKNEGIIDISVNGKKRIIYYLK